MSLLKNMEICMKIILGKEMRFLDKFFSIQVDQSYEFLLKRVSLSVINCLKFQTDSY